jgi:hypothetical protein
MLGLRSLGGLVGQGFNDSDVLEKFFGKIVAVAQVFQEIQTLPLVSSRTRILSGRSMAMLGAASIRGVPALGEPKTSSFVGGIFMSTFSASPLWSIRAKRVTPLASNIPFSRMTV